MEVPEVAEVVAPAAAAAGPEADGRMSLAAAAVLLRALAELLALVRMSLCSLNPSLLCCDDVDSLEIG